MKLFSKGALKAAKAMALIPLTSLLLSEAAHACKLGETRFADEPQVTLTNSRRTTSQYWTSRIYTAPPGWAILHFDYRFINKSARRPQIERPNHFTWRWLSSGTNYASYESIHSAYSRAIDTAARAGNHKLVANLREEASQVLAVASSVYPGRGAVEILIMNRVRGGITVTILPHYKLLCVGNYE